MYRQNIHRSRALVPVSTGVLTFNAAERGLRHLVVSRKISVGTRSPDGSDTKMRLASFFGTWRARGPNPFAECRRLLASPQP